MNTMILIGCVLLTVAFILVGLMAINAPDGWEDEDGFHYGEK